MGQKEVECQLVKLDKFDIIVSDEEIKDDDMPYQYKSVPNVKDGKVAIIEVL